MLALASVQAQRLDSARMAARVVQMAIVNVPKDGEAMIAVLVRS